MKEVKEAKQKINLLLVSIIGIFAMVAIIFVFSNSNIQKSTSTTQQDVVGEASPTCRDSDSGLTYDRRGRTCQGTSCSNDYCKDDYNVVEYYCENGAKKSSVYKCPIQCLNGACKSTAQTSPSAHIEIPSYGDRVSKLVVDSNDGFGCSIPVSNGETVGYDLVRDVDLTPCVNYLPPSTSDIWSLKVQHQGVTGSKGGRVEVFTIHYKGKTYNGIGLPVNIFSPSVVFTTKVYINPFKSLENVDAFKSELFNCILERQPTAGDVIVSTNILIDLYKQFFSAGEVVKQSLRLVFGSGEYKLKGKTNDAYVQQLYRCVLLRDGSSAEVSYWNQQLQGEQTREQVLNAFLASDEFRNNILPTAADYIS